MASTAQIRANQQNAQRSTGPKTPEGKEQSRRNALKHGLTGSGAVIPEADAAEVERRAAAFVDELEAVGEVETALARRAALNSVRMERGADQQTAALSDRLRQVETEFVPPGGVSEAEAIRLRDQACRRAMFDPSKEATLARRYEAAAERGFVRALKELRLLQRNSQTLDLDTKVEIFRQELGSISDWRKMDAEFDARYAKNEVEVPSTADPMPRRSVSVPPATRIQPAGGSYEVPFAIGRPR